MDDKILDLSKPLQHRSGGDVIFVGKFKDMVGKELLAFYASKSGLFATYLDGKISTSGEYGKDVINVPPKPVVTYKNVYPGSQKGGTEWPTLEDANRTFLVDEPRICLLRIERVEGVVTSVEVVKD